MELWIAQFMLCKHEGKWFKMFDVFNDPCTSYQVGPKGYTATRNLGDERLRFIPNTMKLSELPDGQGYVVMKGYKNFINQNAKNTCEVYMAEMMAKHFIEKHLKGEITAEEYNEITGVIFNRINGVDGPMKKISQKKRNRISRRNAEKKGWSK